MTRVLIHVGYPKTATTTLQNRWFLPAHEAGLITFFGKYDSEVPTDSTFESVRLRDVLDNGDRLIDRATLADDRINIFSDERMTLPAILKTNSPYPNRESIDPFDVPALLKHATDGIDDVMILITLRNQQSIMNSMYAHYHYYLADHPEYDTWQAYLERELGAEPSIFDFDALVDRYAEHFETDDIEIRLFERFVNERETYVDELARLLAVDRDALASAAVTDAHENKKEKRDDAYVKEMGTGTAHTVRNALNRVYSVHEAESLVERLIGEGRTNRLKERFFMTDVEIERPNEAQQRRILERFEPGNDRLAAEFGLDRSVLRTYEYVQ